MSINLLPSEEKIKYKKTSETAQTIEMVGPSTRQKTQPGVKRSGVLMFFKQAFARPKKAEFGADQRLPEKKVLVEEKIIMEKQRAKASPRPVIQYTAARPESLQVKSGKNAGQKMRGFFSRLFAPDKKIVPVVPAKPTSSLTEADRFPKYKTIRAEKILPDRPASPRPVEVVRVQTKQFPPSEKALPQSVVPQKYVAIPREGFPRVEPQIKIQKKTVVSVPPGEVKKTAWQKFVSWLKGVFGARSKKTKLVNLPPMTAAQPEKPKTTLPPRPESVIFRTTEKVSELSQQTPHTIPSAIKPAVSQGANLPLPPAKFTMPTPPPVQKIKPAEPFAAVKETVAKNAITEQKPIVKEFIPPKSTQAIKPAINFKKDEEVETPPIMKQDKKTGLWQRAVDFFRRLFSRKEESEVSDATPGNNAPAEGNKSFSLKQSSVGDNYSRAPGLDWEVNLIPEEAMEKEIPAGKILLLIMIMIIAAGLVFGGWLGVNYYYSNISTKISEINGEIGVIKSEVTSFKKMQDEVDALNLRISDVRTLLDKHVYWAGIFQGLESYTLTDVYYSAMTADVNGKVVLSGSARNYETAIKQLYVFQKAADFVSNVTMSGISFSSARTTAGSANTNTNTATAADVGTKSEAVNFNLGLTVLPAIFYKLR